MMSLPDEAPLTLLLGHNHLVPLVLMQRSLRLPQSPGQHNHQRNESQEQTLSTLVKKIPSILHWLDLFWIQPMKNVSLSFKGGTAPYRLFKIKYDINKT